MSSPLGRFAVRSRQSLPCSRPDGVFSPERSATYMLRLLSTGWWVGLVKTLNLPEGQRCGFFAPLEWDMSSNCFAVAVKEQAKR